MSDKEINDIRKLSPEQRIARLRELQKKNRDEIQEATKMIDQSVREIEVKEELKDIPIPQVKAIDIDSLFGEEEKVVFRTKRFISKQPEQPDEEEVLAEQPLEDTVAQEAQLAPTQEGQVQYNQMTQ